MHYRAVIDQLSLPATLDPLSAVIFVTVLVFTAVFCARRAAYGLAALIAVQPFAFYHAAFGTTVTLPKVVLLGTIAGLLSYSGAFASLREREFRPLFAALAALAVATALTFVDASDRSATLRETLKALEYLVLCATAFACYRLDRDDLPLVTAAAGATIVVCASALVQELLGAPSGLCVGSIVVPRIAGVLEGPNQLAGFLESAIALLAAWTIVRPFALAKIALALAATTCVLTFSRAGIAAAIVALAALAFVYRRDAWNALRWATSGFAIGAAIAAGWAAVLHAGGVLRLTLDESTCAGGVGGRNELYRAAWTFFLRHPLLGIGAGNFEFELPLAGASGVRTHANSWYLQSLAEGGIVLFSATIALVVTTLATLRNSLRTSAWTSAAAAATLALALHQVVDYLFFYPKVAGPWLILIGIAAASIASPARERTPA